MTTPSTSTPADETGDGPVTIEDRVEPGGEGSPGSNQSKPEPMAPSGTHSETPAPPELGDMNVGAGDPQAPSHPALPASAPPQPPAAGGEPSTAAGTAQRAPGSLGSTPPGESVGTDVTASAAAMSTPVDPAPGDAPGSSQEQDVVRGARTPEA
jgi:hypothetical protein